MDDVLIRHRTSYQIQVPFQLGPLRRGESCKVRLKTFNLNIRPNGQAIWAHDVFRKAYATAAFGGLTDELIMDSAARGLKRSPRSRSI